MSQTPTRIDNDIYEAARAAGERLSRSTAQQVNHWARIGKELEMSSTVTARHVSDVLEGRTRYDDIPATSQAAVRAAWDERIADTIANLDLTRVLEEAGATYVTADEHGVITRHTPGAQPEIVDRSALDEPAPAQR